MNEEIEIKVILKNPEELEQRLNDIAQFIKEKTQKDEYFVPAGNDFFAVNPTKEYLRIRHQQGKSEMGYHYCHFNDSGELLKTDGYETVVEDPEMTAVILEKLGFTKKVTVTKQRKYYEYKDFEILIDYIEELGYFLEIEAKKRHGNVEETIEQCYALLDEIGAKWEKTSKEGGYPDRILKKMQ